MGDHIPGKPHIVARTMAGGGSRIAAGYIANVAPKDGTVLGTADQSLAVEQAMGDKTLQFDTTKFIYIGNPEADNNTTVTWCTSGVKTIEDATKREVTVGATGGSTSSQYPKAMNALLGTKFKIVVGYPGGNDIDLAMERGEVEGRGSNSWSSWKATHPDWLRDKKINILVQIGLAKAPDLPDVPLLMDLAKNDQDRAVLKLLSAPTTIGRPLFTTPDVPPERVKALRDAFDATMKDPAFLAQAKKQNFDLNPVSGEEMQKIVAEHRRLAEAAHRQAQRDHRRHRAEQQIIDERPHERRRRDHALVAEDLLRAQLAAATRLLVMEGILDYSGHISVRVPGRDAFLIQAGIDPRAEVTPQRLLLVDFDGRVIEGAPTKPPVELPIHLEILKARPDVAAVVHSHMELAICFTMMEGVSLVPMRARAVRWQSGIPTDPDPSHIKLAEQGKALAATLGPHHAALMRAHGLVLVAESLARPPRRRRAFRRECPCAHASPAGRPPPAAADASGDRGDRPPRDPRFPCRQAVEILRRQRPRRRDPAGASGTLGE